MKNQYFLHCENFKEFKDVGAQYVGAYKSNNRYFENCLFVNIKYVSGRNN